MRHVGCTWALLAVILAGCSNGGAGSARDGGGVADAAAAVDAGRDGGGRPAVDGSLPDGGLPPDLCGIVHVGGRPTCPGHLADVTFRNAVCSCGGGFLDVTTDSYDSSMGLSSTTMAGAPVGTVGELVSFGSASGPPYEIGGSVLARGDVDFHSLVVHGDLWVGGRMLMWGGHTLRVRRDLHAAGAIETAGSPSGRVQVDRDLIQVAGVTNTADVDVAGESRTAPVTALEGCFCTDDKLIDVASVVLAGATSHDDDTLGLLPDALAEVTAHTTVELGCGRYFFEGVHVSGGATLTFRVTGHASLLVDGGFAAASGSRIRAEIGEAGELDLFVRGAFTEPPAPGTDGFDGVLLGSPETAARVRIYVTEHPEDRAIQLPPSPLAFYGNLYAPRAMVTGGGSVVYGSIFAESTNLNGVTVHYDRAVLRAADACPDEPVDECDSCGDCSAGEGCVGGYCGGCESDADCCAPLICYPGMGCGPLLI